MPNDPRLKHLDRRIDGIGLSQYTRKCLQRGNIRTVRELAALSDQHLSGLRGCGPKTMREIRDALARLSLTLGTVFDAHGNIVSPDLKLIEKTSKLRKLTEKS